MSDQSLETRILEHVLSPDYQPVKPRVIARKLELPPELDREVRRTIKSLVRKGQLGWGRKRVVLPPGAAAKLARSDHGLIIGEFRRAAAGYGFVRPSGTPAAAGRNEDIYIPLRRTSDAASGDTVRVRLRRGRPGDPRKRGTVVEVVERDTQQFVGILLERGGETYVQIDGGIFAEPIPVSDAAARQAGEGDKVVVEMLHFPTHFHPGEGVIREVLGPPGAPGVDTLSIIREFGLPEHFSREALDTARAQAALFDESLGDRLDLTGATIVTIDPRDARDFDDAISLDRLENGHWRLGVHIADVAHFVPPGSPLDDEARERGTSVYLPDRVLPMLPELISNGLASLQPGKLRYAQSVFIEFTAEGARVGAEFARSAIVNQRRFSYEEVDEFLNDPRRGRADLSTGVFALLGRMRELALLLRRRRLDQGAIELNLPEIKIELDQRGRVQGAHVVAHTLSHQIIEEFMLAANEAVAEHMQDHELNFLRRVHEPPDPRKLRALTEFVRELGIESESLENRFEIKRVVEAMREDPRRFAVHYAVLRSFQKAVYGPQNEGHYALNSRHYCHFTSPIRRYPDLVIHRMLDRMAQGKRPPDDFDQLAVIGNHCSDREQRAEAAERELIKVKLLSFLSTRIGQRMEAVVTGVEKFGLFVQGIELPAEGLVRVETLADDYYRFDSSAHTLTGYRQGNTYRLGDLLLVEIAFVDVDSRQLDFRLVQRLKEVSGIPKLTRRTSGKPRASRKNTAPRRKKS